MTIGLKFANGGRSHIELLKWIDGAGMVMFEPEDVSSPVATSYILSWQYYKNDLYSVKSAYSLACLLIIDDSFAMKGNCKII